MQCHIYLHAGTKSNLLKCTREEHISGVYSDSSQTSDMELFPKTVYTIQRRFIGLLTDASVSLRAVSVLSYREINLDLIYRFCLDATEGRL